MLSVTEVDRVTVTTVVDNYVDLLRQDEKVARRCCSSTKDWPIARLTTGSVTTT